MPHSMTGFVSLKENFGDYDIDVKVKSLNGRSLEVNLKGDKTVVNLMELQIRKLTQNFFERGSISIVLNIDYKKPVLNIDPEKLKNTSQDLREIFLQANLNPSDDKIVEYSIVYSSSNSIQELSEEFKNNILSTLAKAFELLKLEREKEGSSLVEDIKQRLLNIQEHIDRIEKEKESIVDVLQQKMIQKVKQLLGEEYSERAFIEASLIAQKLDITEEIVRLKNHIMSFFELLTLQEPVGRKMDFLCQEMHREINTLGNKMPDFSKITIEIKSQIEKIRQQVQNIE